MANGSVERCFTAITRTVEDYYNLTANMSRQEGTVNSDHADIVIKDFTTCQVEFHLH